MIISPRLDIYVSQQEDGQDDDDNVPAREDQTAVLVRRVAASHNREHLRESVTELAEPCGIVPSRECDHSRNLQQANLERIRRSNFHAVYMISH